MNAMETIDNDLGGSQSAKPNLPSLMFKIASKSKLTSGDRRWFLKDKKKRRNTFGKLLI